MKLRTIKRRHVEHHRLQAAIYRAIYYVTPRQRERWRQEAADRRIRQAAIIRMLQPTDAERNALYMWAPKWHTYKTITND